MVPSLIVKITWHIPGGRYHSPSIITAYRRRCHAALAARSASSAKTADGSTSAGFSPSFNMPRTTAARFGCLRPTDLPGRVPPGGYRASLRHHQEQRPSQCRQVSSRRRAGVLHAACHSRRSVMTPEVTARAQQFLGAGRSRNEVAERLGLKRDTLRKAIQQGRLIEPCPLEPEPSVAENAPAQPTPSATDPGGATRRRHLNRAQCHRPVHAGGPRCRRRDGHGLHPARRTRPGVLRSARRGSDPF